jgi:predicted phosphodiesterase
MKLAVLADIHANVVALQCVAEHIETWRPDTVVVAGDIVNRGPRPVECLRFVQKKQQTHGWYTVRGNHEDYVISCSQPDAPRNGPEFDIVRTGYWTYRQLNANVAALAAMPFQQSLGAPDGSEARITHASMRGNRDGIYPETTDDELRRQIQPPSPLLCVGHTHRPLVRKIDKTLVVNVGAAGLPFDGDPRASYARLIWQAGEWQVEIVRLDYDRQQAEQDFYASGFMEESGALAPLILNEFRTARSRLYQWAAQYEAAVLAGKITIEKSVENFLAPL